MPVGFVSGLPFPGVTVCAANATPETDIVRAIVSAAINNVMRFLICSHLLSLLANTRKPAYLSFGEIAGCATGSPVPVIAPNL